MEKEKIYQAAMYVRLSREDEDVASAKKTESESIQNQKRLIRDFVSQHSDIEIAGEYEDDGYTGSDFNRPGFQAMLEDIRKGIIDCVIVKDLSRFGREYIDSGRYIERLFPSLGIRFIAITDHIDRRKGGDDDIVIPFKNLMNDAYCRDISIKIRSNLEAKRRDGKCVSAFVPYGYLKDKTDRNKLIIDPYAGSVVRDIFRMKLSGMSQKAIAEYLDAHGILSPLEYKHSIGINIQSNFKKYEKATWDSTSVRRILENEVYTGTLTQGRFARINHKIKKTVEKPQDEWIRIEDSHEPIISKREFEICQRLMRMDTRVPIGEDCVYPLAGVAVCGSCGAQMIKKEVPAGGKIYEYYLCGSYIGHTGCSPHRIPKKKLEDVTFELLKGHIESIIHLEEVLDFANKVPFKDLEVKRLSDRKEVLEKDVEKWRSLRDNLYEDMKEGIVTKEEYIELRASFSEKRNGAEAEIHRIDNEIADILDDKSDKFRWLKYFIDHKNLESLTRGAVIQLIDKVIVHDKKNVEVVFNFDDCYQELLAMMEEV